VILDFNPILLNMKRGLFILVPGPISTVVRNVQTYALVIFAMLTALTVNAQVWSPPGATWTYSYSNQFSITGYVEIKYVGDSVVGGQLTKVLEKTRYSLEQFSGVQDTIDLGKEFTYLDSNVVYYYRLGQFFVLYDFNSQANDVWTIAGENGIGVCDSIGAVQVDSTATIIINTDTLKSLTVSAKDTTDWQFGTTIMERIGCTDAYMFPEPTLCIIDYNEGGPFRCYWDDSFPIYSSGIAASCDFITSIEQINPDVPFKIYPNPTSGSIALTNLSRQATEINIYNNLGEWIYGKQLNGLGEATLNLSALTSGVYVCHISVGATTLQRRIIKL